MGAGLRLHAQPLSDLVNLSTVRSDTYHTKVNMVVNGTDSKRALQTINGATILQIQNEEWLRRTNISLCACI